MVVLEKAGCISLIRPDLELCFTVRKTSVVCKVAFADAVLS